MELLTLELEEHQTRLKRLSKILFEYLLVISPGSEAMKMLTEFKIFFSKKYGCQLAATLIPHLTLVNFQQVIKNEKRIVTYFENFSKRINPFEMQLNGFGQFQKEKDKNVIYANVETKLPVIKIVKDIRANIGGFLKVVKAPDFSLNPHITIARGMTDVQFYKAWPEWMDKEYKSIFPATEMLLLRREIIDGKYKEIEKFRFCGNGYSTEQSKLF